MNTIGLRRRSSNSNWKKLLYQKQAFPDNYTDESFLSQLKRNETVVQYKYWQLVKDFSLILFHMTNLVLVLLIFTGIYQYNFNPTIILTISSITSISGLIIWEINLNKAGSNMSRVKSIILLMFILLIISPVLKSLTRSTSSDSIWSISLLITLSNLIFHDYAIDLTVPYYKPIISTNLSLSNALVLASRLNSTWQVFCFILSAIQLNILMPLFDFSLRKYSMMAHYVLLALINLVVDYLMWKLSNINVMLFWGAIQIFIVFIMPGYFLYLQRYKNELSGPWDIAKPIIRSHPHGFT